MIPSTVPRGADLLGMTLAEYAAAHATHPQHARSQYARLMREGDGAILPAVTRVERNDGLTKFCLPVGTHPGMALETESVIIPMRNYSGMDWYTLCLSSQVGCRMGCTFCETGRMGLLRNLSSAEIVRQRLVARQLMLDQDPLAATRPFRYFSDGIRNLVFMGMGEPLDNFDAVVQAIRVFNDPRGLDIPLTQVTISTVGRIDGIRKLAQLNWPNLRLAISLNAPNDRLRDELMPINKGMPLADLQLALLDYPLPRRGLFLIEYVLIKDVNDAPALADEVAAWCRPLRCVVNVIPYNPQRDASYATPSDDAIVRFCARLRSQGVFVKRRITHGRDLMGACGQLGNPDLRRVQRSSSSSFSRAANS
ncbi:MAG: 23S rRNA (adenine(2503)-C(2))-methyltransferase RlmN [Deltaproteobacteria bacterium]|nr:23S rRNA (adenine(2503)-C(2))-methyltransferase RlmN [Deltaproteobacteria bacterium]MBI3390407.1 23S rRNA (adenine(2503)-C(2))-methyltransferase RlmN [Deltaproteobacteria bacterium]